MKRNNTVLSVGVVVVIVILVVVGVIIAKGGDTDSDKTMDMSQQTGKQSDQQTDTTKAVATDTVTIEDFAFSPAAITVKVGAKVTWTNQDAVGHTVTADEGEGPDSQLLAKGESYSYTFTKTGTYTYHCTPHPNMQGSVIVTN
jgi:amicyanin